MKITTSTNKKMKATTDTPINTVGDRSIDISDPMLSSICEVVEPTIKVTNADTQLD